MQLRKSPSNRTWSVVAAVAVAALIAASCGGEDAPVSQPAAQPSTSVAVEQPAPSVTVRGEHPCDTGDGRIDGSYCQLDGQWYFDAGAGNWVEIDVPPVTATTVAEADTGEPEVTEEEPEGVPADEPVSDENDSVPVGVPERSDDGAVRR